MKTSHLIIGVISFSLLICLSIIEGLPSSPQSPTWSPIENLQVYGDGYANHDGTRTYVLNSGNSGVFVTLSMCRLHSGDMVSIEESNGNIRLISPASCILVIPTEL